MANIEKLHFPTKVTNGGTTPAGILTSAEFNRIPLKIDEIIDHLRNPVTWESLTGKPTTFPPSSHQHLWKDIIDPPQTYTPSAHTHTTSDISNLETWISGKKYITARSVTWSLLLNKPSWLTPFDTYTTSPFYTKNEMNQKDKGYVHIAGYEEVSGEKDFTSGIYIGGHYVRWDSINNAFIFEGNLYATGEVSAYGAGSHSGGGGLSWADLTQWDGTSKTIDRHYIPNDIGGVSSWSEIASLGDFPTWLQSNPVPSWLPKTNPYYLTSVWWSDLQGTAPNISIFNNDVGYVMGSELGKVAFWDSVPWEKIANTPTTISDYGITDAKISGGTITLGDNSITPLTANSTLDATKLTNTVPLTSIPKLTFEKMPPMYWADLKVTDAANKGAIPTLGAIELLGSDNASAMHGGYIDFHYGKSTNDYTSRIIEWGDGLKVSFGATPTKHFYIENGALRIGNYILSPTTDGLQVTTANGQSANLYATGEVGAYKTGSGGASVLNFAQLNKDNVFQGDVSVRGGFAVHGDTEVEYLTVNDDINFQNGFQATKTTAPGQCDRDSGRALFYTMTQIAEILGYLLYITREL